MSRKTIEKKLWFSMKISENLCHLIQKFRKYYAFEIYTIFLLEAKMMHQRIIRIRSIWNSISTVIVPVMYKFISLQRNLLTMDVYSMFPKIV